MLAEFFAANPLETADDLLEKGPHRRFLTVAAKSLTLVNIASLGQILGVGTYQEVVISRPTIGTTRYRLSCSLAEVPR